ncbi:hypothetical protein LTR53_013972, partial [Teratosphaeriaceae sp. CCFEE 6253]
MTLERPAWHTAATANIREANRKNGRLGSTKSRGGCVTCRGRRVKCDQTHPACRRCADGGRRCGGYASGPLASKKGSDGTLEISGTSGHGSNDTVPNAPLSQTLGVGNGDIRTFDFFVSFTAPRLSGSLDVDKDFWCGTILQIAQTEPLVMDSLLAISVLYEHPQFLEAFPRDAEPIGQPVGDGMKTAAMHTGTAIGPRLDPHHAKALVAYNRAIEAVRRRMLAGTATPLLALLSCTLFFCVEVIRDDVFAALALFSKGSGLLKQFERLRFVGQEMRIVETLRGMFGRIGVLAATFGHPNTMAAPATLVAEGKGRAFASMEDARASLYAIMADSHSFIQNAAAHKASILGRAARTMRSVGTLLDDGLADAAGLSSHEPIRLAGLSDRTADFHSPSIGNETYDFPYNEGTPTSAKSLEIRVDSGATTPATGQTMTDLIDRQKRLEARLTQWYDAFHWARKAPAGSDSAAVSSLLMHYHVSTV